MQKYINLSFTFKFKVPTLPCLVFSCTGLFWKIIYIFVSTYPGKRFKKTQWLDLAIKKTIYNLNLIQETVFSLHLNMIRTNFLKSSFSDNSIKIFSIFSRPWTIQKNIQLLEPFSLLFIAKWLYFIRILQLYYKLVFSLFKIA